MTGAINDNPNFPIGTFWVRILAARGFIRGNRQVGVVDIEITTDGAPVNTQIEFLLDAPAGPSAVIVLRDLRLLDAWRRLVGVEDVPAGAARPFPVLMRATAFRSLNKAVLAEIAADRSPWGWKPRIISVSITEPANV